MKRKILFLVDHKHRDLPSLTLIGCHLESLGFESHYVALTNELEVIARIDPGYIVLPKCVYDFERLVWWKMDGRRLILIESEGNHQDREIEMRVRIPPDLYLFWNQTMAERYRPQLEGGGTTICVIGFPRSDFLHPRMDGVFPSREQLLSRYGLDVQRRTLTLATSSQDSHFSEERLQEKRMRRSRSFAKTANYLDIVANMGELRDKTVDFLERVVNGFPDVNVALKPHPHENAVFWSNLIDSLRSPRVALVVGEPINHLLRVSDLHVSYNVCTTTVEALMTGLPAAEIHASRSDALYAERHLCLPTYKVNDFEDLARAIEGELVGEPAGRHLEDSNRAKLNAYVSDFFFASDGRRCEAYARTIAEWAGTVDAAPRGRAYLMANPKQAAMYLALRARNSVRDVLNPHFNRRRREIATKVNAPKLDHGRSVRRIKGVLVDEEFGLYDNRMRPGDEKVWIEKYRRAGITDEPAPGDAHPSERRTRV